MNRDSKGRFCKANKIKSTKIPFLSNIAMHRKNPVKAKEILDKLKEKREDGYVMYKTNKRAKR